MLKGFAALLTDRRRATCRRPLARRVDDFTDETGAVVGMNSMTMSLPVGREASLKGITVGDKI
jgi:hypothetical protein